MECLPVILGFFITFSGSLIIETARLQYYVIPNRTLDCPNEYSTCLTFQEYASQPDEYFTSNVSFYFESGRHMLKSSLNFVNIHNFTFQGLPDTEVAT